MRISSTGNSNVNMAVVFVGLLANAVAGVEYIPALQGNYSLPGIYCTTVSGDVTVLGVGNNPSSESFADVLSLVFRSRDGKIKVEINGGSVNANYSISSGAGSAVFEIDGDAVANQGVIGDGSSGLNQVYVRSETDNVQVAILASPL